MPTLDERLRTERSSRKLTQEEIASIIKKAVQHTQNMKLEIESQIRGTPKENLCAQIQCL